MRIFTALNLLGFTLGFVCFCFPVAGDGPWDSSLTGSVYGSNSMPTEDRASGHGGFEGYDDQGDQENWDQYENGDEGYVWQPPQYGGWSNDNGWAASPCGYGHTNCCDMPNPCVGCCTSGVFMPECPVLFKPLLADPRQLWYSLGWRFNDEVFVQNIIDVSFADTFPIYRWWNVFFCGDSLQIEIEGALWAVFDPLHYSSPLVNADYYGGVPITYAMGPWSCRLRMFHISSHIGDEFLLNHPGFNRLNPSAEYIDLFVSYQFNPELRIYAGYGYIVQADESFPFKRNYLEWGLETYFRRGQFYLPHHCLSGEPYFAMHFRAREDNDFHEDGTYVLGYEFSKHSGICRKWRVFMQYHQGYSCEGQFSRQRTDYFSLRTSYWF